MTITRQKTQKGRLAYPALSYGYRPIFDIMTTIRVDRFHRKIDSTAGRFGCWPWLGSRNTTGYGLFQGSDAYRGWSLLAHRIAWALANDIEPHPSAVIRHKCDTPLCCNPAHLLIGDHADNYRDMVDRGRRRTGKRGIHAAHRGLPEVAWKMRYQEWLPREEIAAALGVHVATVTRWHRALLDRGPPYPA